MAKKKKAELRYIEGTTIPYPLNIRESLVIIDGLRARIEFLMQSNSQYSRVNQVLLNHNVEFQGKIETLRAALWDSEKESNERKKQIEKLFEEVGQLETQLDLAAETNWLQNKAFEATISKNQSLESNLRREISELRIRLFVATLAPIIYEWAAPAGFIEIPLCLNAFDALKYQEKYIEKLSGKVSKPQPGRGDSATGRNDSPSNREPLPGASNSASA